MKRKPILCLDFDGVIHSYTSGWQGAEIAEDPPVPGALDFLICALFDFDVHIYSSRSQQEGGLQCMQAYLYKHCPAAYRHRLEELKFPVAKPAAFLTIDDRAIQFTGEWPTIDELLNFKPWNKKEPTQ